VVAGSIGGGEGKPLKDSLLVGGEGRGENS